MSKGEYAGTHNMMLLKGVTGWTVIGTCPKGSCGVRFIASGPNESGPFDGRCENGHGIYIDNVKKGPKL